jgi:hypothetical protein
MEGFINAWDVKQFIKKDEDFYQVAEIYNDSLFTKKRTIFLDNKFNKFTNKRSKRKNNKTKKK